MLPIFISAFHEFISAFHEYYVFVCEKYSETKLTKMCMCMYETTNYTCTLKHWGQIEPFVNYICKSEKSLLFASSCCNVILTICMINL